MKHCTQAVQFVAIILVTSLVNSNGEGLTALVCGPLVELKDGAADPLTSEWYVVLHRKSDKGIVVKIPRLDGGETD